MKNKIAKILFAISVIAAPLAARADLLFSDGLNYPNGLIETDGLWYCYSPASPDQDALVNNDLLILNSANHDAVAAPTNGIVNSGAPDVVYASFTINVSQLPSVNGGFFCDFMDPTNNTVAHVFIDTKNTVVPGTYRLGIGNFASSITAAGVTNFPMDLATDITYQVVFSWDEVNGYGATLWVNPSLATDQYVYGTDVTNNQPFGLYLQTMPVSTIGFSQYGGVQAIGNVMIGNQFGDVMTNVAQLPVIGVQPLGATNYAGNNLTLYTAASGMDVTYQWLANNVPLSDNGTTIVGSGANILNLTNLQASANYSVVATDAAGSVTSAVAVVSININPTPPFFTVQPQSQTNSLLSSVTLTAAANGTGPMTYQWYFEPAGTSSGFTALSGATSPTLTFTAGYGNSGSYYVTATGGAGSFNSATANVLVIPPPLVTIGYMHQFITNLNSNVAINNNQIFNVEGVVTSIGQIESASSSEFFIQDGTGGCLVYAGGYNVTNTPPVGALVNVISPAESYYGELEMDPTTTAATNKVQILSTNNPLPAPIPLNIAAAYSQNESTQGTYGCSNQCSLVTLTNVYLYSSKTGAAVSGNFPTNKYIGLYAFQQPYSAGAPYVEVYVYTYTNAVNQLNTNYWGKPIPSFCYEITAALGVYNPTTAEPYPSRYADFVTTKPASFSTSMKMTNGVPTLTWPAVIGQTYSVYTATSVVGPWTPQAFGLGYYPSVGAYADTNAASPKFYQVSTP
jgi:hypothetical protein